MFWITFVLSFMLSRPLIIATRGAYRIGVIVFALGLLLIVLRLRLKNPPLLISILLLGAVAAISGVINSSSPLQFISFARIPVTAYLVYYIVAGYFTNTERVIHVFRIMYLIALIQLPVLLAQRSLYPYLPASLKFSVLQGQLEQVDFAMGTFDGDAPMTFFVISLLILLLFYKHSDTFIKYKWPMAIWLTLTVLVANSQIQHLLLAGIWFIYLLSHLRPKTIFVVMLGAAILVAAIGYLDQSGVLTFSPVEHTRARASQVFSTTGRQERIDLFLSGYHARDGAIFYYLKEPVNWFGDGPARYYNTVTRERTLGSWGHLFTFYAEVGVIGWALSMLIFFIIAFPLSIKPGELAIQVSWVQSLMFLSVGILSMARYPMNTIPMIFTYCIVLFGYSIVAQPRYWRVL
jgi:hypothetical protein